ncbi:MAG: RHS repeat protein, partial [Phycisphaeraceae bacterium]|nr:RHS repeat protein [Phycisphaeraceae bacterium]
MPDSTIAAEIAFTRDHLDRIVQITDLAPGSTGQSIHYTYDINGDLVAVTDRVGSTTTFIYDAAQAGSRERFLTSIEDARGISVMNLNFDAITGRIISLADASGAAIPFTYDLNPPQLPAGYTREVLADADDVPTEIIRDSRGNTVRQLQRVSDNGTINDTTDDLWSVTVYEYDANDYRTRTAETFQATGDTAYTAVPTVWLSTADYDPFGQVLSVSDTLGNTTYFTYDRYGSLLTTTDSQGNTNRNTYSDKGLLTATTDALGNVTSYGYDSNGNMTAVTDSTGNVVSTFVYDSKNQLLSTTDINGNSRFFMYDSGTSGVGNQTHSWSYNEG